MRTDRLEEAETSFLQAVDLHKQAQAVLNWLEEAETSLLQAADLYKDAQSTQGQAYTHKILNHLYYLTKGSKSNNS
ncbi:hypothetical protein PILCRDRAFT_10468 [Piloderma croceum F 1598]|uniref:Uncharacterized protein n=1 Tax=Piloderma croceum (strain F 1598) TaxID=765440 RepID=A0A0C3F3I7_PILCF|nr:hypothetical protein PILCRDRAFT_10468 [Piloderma croceum F 1598]